MVGPQGGGTVTLSEEQIEYLTLQVNAAGSQHTPPYTYMMSIPVQTGLAVVVGHEASGKRLAVNAKQKNNWEQTEDGFQIAVADVVNTADAGWVDDE